MDENNNSFDGGQNPQEEQLSPKEAKRQAKAKKKAVRSPWYVKLIGIFFPIIAVVLAIIAATNAEKGPTTSIILCVVAIILAVGTGVICFLIPAKKKKRKFVFGFVISIIALVISAFYPPMVIKDAIGKNKANPGGSSGGNNASVISGKDSSQNSAQETSEGEVDYDLAFTYKQLDDNTYEISGLTNLGKGLSNLYVPASHGGKAVTSIGERAFMNITVDNPNSSFKKIELPDSITNLEKYAFKYCRAETVKLPSGLVSIPKYSFNAAGIQTIELPSSVVTIESGAFSESTLTEISLTNVTEIETDAFKLCSALTKVTFGDNLKTIGQNAFNGDSNLTTVTFGAHAPYILSGAFTGCDKLTYYTNDNIKYLGNETNHYLVLMNGVNYTGNVLEIPNTTECIYPYSFNYYNSTDKCYEGNYKIKSFQAPANLKYIGAGAFAYTTIETVTFGSGSKIDTIGSLAFYQSSLDSINLPEGIKTVDDPFRETQLTSIHIPSTVENFDLSTFMQMSRLTTITFAANHPDYSSYDGCVFDKACTKLLRVPSGLLVGNYTLPNYAPTIAKYAVLYPDANVTITIPVGVTTIETSAFQDRQNTERAGDQRHIIGIDYAGTMSQWEAVTKNKNWCRSGEENISSMKFHIVHCSDGQVELYDPDTL